MVDSRGPGTAGGVDHQAYSGVGSRPYISPSLAFLYKEEIRQHVATPVTVDPPQTMSFWSAECLCAV